MGTEVSEVEAFDYSTLGEKEGFVRGVATRIKAHSVRAVESLVEVGLELTTVKAVLDHGQFTGWLDAEFAWSARTAQNYMRAADHFKNETVSHLTPSAMYLLSSPSVPESARDEAKERAASGEMITPEVAKEIKANHAIESDDMEPEHGGTDPAEDACPNCGGTERQNDEFGRCCAARKDPGTPSPPRVNEIDLSDDDEPVVSKAALRVLLGECEDLMREIDIRMKPLIEKYPSDRREDLGDWWKQWGKEVKKGND